METAQTFATMTLKPFADLQGFFAEKKHKPSAEMLLGLYNLQDTLTKMLVGELQPMYYLSSLDPGVGKTSAIKAWLKAYLPRRKEYSDKGVILCFDRLEEIKQFLDAVDIPGDSYGVLVSTTKAEGWELVQRGVGEGRQDQAAVLLTTKQQIIRRTLGGIPFAAVTAFHYKGAPRVVRVWDESMTVGKALTLSAFQMLELLNTVARKDMELAGTLKSLANDLERCADGDTLDMPDLGGMELGYSFRWPTSTMRDTAETLALLSGRVVTVRVDGSGRVALDCVQSLPEDFKPCLVTDASIRIRETYRLQEAYREDVVRLAPETSCKRYDDLTVYVWHKRTGKMSYRIEGVEAVAKEVAKVVTARPGEAFLIVVTKENHGKMSRALKGLLPSDQERLKFLTWGMHTATNEFVDIANVVITSQLYYRLADYEAGARAAATLMTSKGAFSEEQLQAFRRGETAHHLLQCICRGAVRKAVGNQCPPSRCWIISAKGMKVEEQLPDIFPGCSVKTWEGAPVVVKGRRQEVLEFIVDRLQAGTQRLPAALVRTTLGIGSTSNFKRSYLTDSSFLSLCHCNGVIVSEGSMGQYFELNPFRS